MTLPDAAYIQIADMRVCRILNGLWQLSGAHGHIDRATALPQMIAYHRAGLTTWDLADHYGPAEDFIGEFRSGLAEAEKASHLAFTKWVPRPDPMTHPVVEQAIDRSLKRMRVNQLDMLQFHWWDYSDSRYLDALNHMLALQKKGKIRHLALTNFDTQHVKIIIEHGIPIVTNQVQYSLIDQRPAVSMAEYCQGANIKLLTYGTLAGGLLTDRFLGQPAPTPDELNTASLRKYSQMIHAWGGWGLLQELLRTLRKIADKHHVSIANVAVRWVLDQPTVGGVIIGARLGIQEHIAENTRVFNFMLDDDDRNAIQTVTNQGRDLYALIGDTGDEYRR